MEGKPWEKKKRKTRESGERVRGRSLEGFGGKKNREEKDYRARRERKGRRRQKESNRRQVVTSSDSPNKPVGLLICSGNRNVLRRNASRKKPRPEPRPEATVIHEPPP